MAMHPIVLATIRRHLAEAELRVAVLKSKREEIPATRGAMVAASRVSRQILQAQAQADSWTAVVDAMTIEEAAR